MWNLDATVPDKVIKAARSLFKLKEFAETYVPIEPVIISAESVVRFWCSECEVVDRKNHKSMMFSRCRCLLNKKENSGF